MSRLSALEQLYSKKSALDFNYDNLKAPLIRSIFSEADIKRLTKIAMSPKYSANIDLKKKLIDAVMIPKGFRKAHAGTNRIVYYCLDNPTFVAKVAIDSVGMEDTPAEMRNQEFLKPFCCKIFEVTENGILGFVERVNPISSIEEFASVAEDIFNLMITKIIGKYVVADLSAKKYMNFGVRINSQGYEFGPVVIDYPYVYELDDKKLVCAAPIQLPTGEVACCNGEIDYTDDLDALYCTKCGKRYKARDLAKPESKIKIMKYDNEEGEKKAMRTRIIDGLTGEVLSDSFKSSKTYVAKEDCKPFFDGFHQREVVVTNTIRPKKKKRRLTQKQKAMRYIRQRNYDIHKAKEKALEEKLIKDEKDPNVIEAVEVKSSNQVYEKKELNKSANKIVKVSTVCHSNGRVEHFEPAIEEDSKTSIIIPEPTNTEIVPIQEEPIVVEPESNDVTEEEVLEKVKNDEYEQLSFDIDGLVESMTSPNNNDVDETKYEDVKEEVVYDEPDNDGYEEDDYEEEYMSFSEYKSKEEKKRKRKKHNNIDE